MSVSRHPFTIRSFDVDAFGCLTAPRLLGYLIESSIRSADQLGFGIARLQTEQLTWVISRTRVILNEDLGVRDELEVETWPSGLKRAAVMRDFRLWKGDRLVGVATSAWFVLDMETRLPQRPNAVFPEHLQAPMEHVVELSRAIDAMSEPPELERRFQVRYSDIDLNEHVTAAAYVGWAVEAITEAQWQSMQLTGLDVQFLEECHLGQEILSCSLALSPNVRLHRITRCSDGHELARLTTTWKTRPTRLRQGD